MLPSLRTFTCSRLTIQRPQNTTVVIRMMSQKRLWPTLDVSAAIRPNSSSKRCFKSCNSNTKTASIWSLCRGILSDMTFQHIWEKILTWKPNRSISKSKMCTDRWLNCLIRTFPTSPSFWPSETTTPSIIISQLSEPIETHITTLFSKLGSQNIQEIQRSKILTKLSRLWSREAGIESICRQLYLYFP